MIQLKYMFASILIMDASIAFIIALQIMISYEKRYIENKILSIFALCSGIWSLGFGMLFLQHDVDKAYVCRSFGILGTIGFMITGQFLINYIAKISFRKRILFNSVSFLGVIVYLLSVQRDQTIYFLSDFGMTYQFKKGIVNDIYTFYFLLVAANMMYVILYMIRKSKYKRIKAFGKQFAYVEVLILLGTILDMVFPALGYPALPGSNVTQFWGLVFVWFAMSKINASRINVKNMSQYIYYSLANPVLVYDSNKTLKITNDAAKDFFNLYHFPTLMEDEFEEKVEELFDVDEDTLFEFHGNHNTVDAIGCGNEVPCSLAVSKIHDEYGDIIGYIVMVTDLSERVKVLKSLEIAKKEADYANQAKSLFLANMSHEIRTPMNAIMGFSELALSEAKDQRIKEYLMDIKQSSEGLLGIINDILNITKIESRKLELVNANYEVSSLFKQVYQMIKQLAEKKGLEFTLQIHDELPRVLCGDEMRVREILINILNNAVKYTQKGSITLQVDILEKADGKVKLRFSIQDTGIGIRDEDRKYLFDSFRRIEEGRNHHIEGSGLGLSIVKGYLDLMGGTIEVESEYGKGSNFIIEITQDIVDATGISPKEMLGTKDFSSHAIGSLRFEQVRVLVVDDNEVNLKVIEKTLDQYGLVVDVTQNGQDAVRLCSIHQYPLVFMDQMMPEMSGEETMRLIRQSISYYRTDGKIIMLTANAFENVREQALSDGFDDYLKKPLEYHELERVLKTYLSDHLLEIRQQEEKKTQEEKVTDMSENQYLDQEDGVAHCVGSYKIYYSVLEITQKNSEQDIQKLMTYYENKDWKQVGVQAHAMKGTCLNIGAKHHGQLAKALELAGKEENITYIEENIQVFIDSYRELMKEITRILNDAHKNETP